MSGIEELKADFKRVYMHYFGVEGWNKAIEEKSLPKWLGYTQEDKVIV